MQAQVDGQRELLRGLESLLDGTRQLEGGLGQFRAAADEVPLFGCRLVEGLAPITQGAQQLGAGLDQARAGQTRLLQGSVRLQEGVRRSLPQEMDRLGGSSQGLAQSVEPLIAVLALVPNQGSALTPNFVPLALWLGAVVQAFRASLFGAFEDAFWPTYWVVVAIGTVSLVIGTVAGRWRAVPVEAWRPPLDMD